MPARQHQRPVDGITRVEGDMRRESPLDETRRLTAMVERSRKRLIDAEITLTESFCDLAETELHMGHARRVQEVLAKGRQALKAAQLCLNRVRMSSNDVQQARTQVESLKARLEELSARSGKARSASAGSSN